MEIAPGAHHFPRFLTIERQRAIADRCRALVDGAVPAYVPIVRGGGKMHVRMLCLGRHWNAKTYQYESTRADFDGLPAPPLPPELRTLAREIAGRAGMRLEPDLCILNYYDANGRMGMHQDKDEGPRIDCRGNSGCIGVDRRHRAISLRRPQAPRSGRRHSLSNPAMRSSSAGLRGCAITACRASLRAPLRQSSSSPAVST